MNSFSLLWVAIKIEVSVKLKGTFKVKFMFELAIFGMATLKENKKQQQQKRGLLLPLR